MKTKKLRIMVLALAVMLAMTGFSYAAASVTKEYSFTTSNKNYAELTLKDAGTGELAEVEKDVKIDGKGYKAVKISFQEVSKDKPIKRTRTYSGLTEKTVPKTYKLKDGTKLKLSDVKWTENTRQAATGTTTYTGTNTRPDAPETKEITASLPDGSTITVTGHLQSVERTGSSYNKPFTVTAKFTGDRDVSYYKLGDTKIPNNPSSPTFAGYQTVLLQNLGYDPDQYKITNGKWTTDYLEENGQTVRYAEFSGLQSTADWTAYYTETITTASLQLATYDATAEYTNGVEETSYSVIATVTYEKVGLTLLQKILIAGAAIVIIAGLIAVILLIIRKKRDKESASSEAA